MPGTAEIKENIRKPSFRRKAESQGASDRLMCANSMQRPEFDPRHCLSTARTEGTYTALGAAQEHRPGVAPKPKTKQKAGDKRQPRLWVR